jgi:hypothetical protein
MITTKIQVARDVPKLLNFDADNNVQRAALDQIAGNARAEAYEKLVEAMETGVTYSVKRSEDQYTPADADRDVTYCVYVVTLEFVANMDTLL